MNISILISQTQLKVRKPSGKLFPLSSYEKLRPKRLRFESMREFTRYRRATSSVWESDTQQAFDKYPMCDDSFKCSFTISMLEVLTLKGQGCDGNGLSYCQQCQKPIWTLVQVPCAPFLIQIPANTLGEKWKIPLYLCVRPWWNAWPLLMPLRLFGPWANGRKIFLSISICFSVTPPFH